ncbi:MAG: glycosyltransferase family 9 protein [Ignavibacteriae bacterium HGW-Ignavibacteriae-3]|nr:MAG: glycosyltransferase family 9 protein [Ignavibacteriae bacterium HGW-Ignavibacteriae-3]
MIIKTDCLFFRGDVPCKPHKEEGVHCSDCTYYIKSTHKILIIKLGAIGDVIRTTPLFSRLQSEYPHSKIFWMTHYPIVVPSEVHSILTFTVESVTYLKLIEFDLVINLDKDREACALASQISAKKKFGFYLKEGTPAPVNDLARHKFLTGLFDDLNKANTKNYLEEIFEICGLKYNSEKYILDPFERFGLKWQLDCKKKIIGLNTGCGGRWVSRLWPEKNWIELASKLLNQGYEVVLLGGEQENEKNLKIAEESGAKYFGYFRLETFINLVNHCDLVVTGVTMAMHITLALNKKIVLFNNIFNRNEFELFGLGEILEPGNECKCFFSPKCKNDKYFCMDSLEVERVQKTIDKLI